ncbi:MAG TPA: hypothetical protein VE033_13215 [Acetobacteraceae bacterium]|jgi:uncharacterized protein YjiS (DUF1127 family)|nr:hypothetical protein [Acetobacteraceae bacterium]
MPSASAPARTHPPRPGRHPLRGKASTAWRRLRIHVAEALRRAREDRELLALDDRELRDIGANRYEVAQELARPRPSLPHVDAPVAQVHRARSEALFRAMTSWVRRLPPPR